MSQKVLVLILSLLLINGCATIPKKQSVESVPITLSPPGSEEIPQQSDSSVELQNIQDEELEGYVEKRGIVFAKTDFKGVLGTSYVKLLLENQEVEENKFQLHIGNKAAQNVLLWDVKSVEPGYFFIELPEGPYKMTSISIPVGTTLATEKIDIEFRVKAGTIVYMGTLQVIGTKEKIKLGGVPVLKPGFEYLAVILDEHEEGIAAFKERYPHVPNEIMVDLMNLNTSE